MGLFSSSKCEICGNTDTKKYSAFKILKTAILPHDMNDHNLGSGGIVEDLGGWDAAYTSTNQLNPVGNIFLFKFSDDYSHHRLCSLKCMFDFAVKTNTAVYYEDLTKASKSRCISPETININKALGRPESDKYIGQ
jgi:hypothetical protein